MGSCCPGDGENRGTEMKVAGSSHIDNARRNFSNINNNSKVDSQMNQKEQNVFNNKLSLGMKENDINNMKTGNFNQGKQTKDGDAQVSAQQSQSHNPNELRYSRTKTKNNQPKNEIKINTTKVVDQKECSPAEFYGIEKRLGEGSYGEVFKVKHKKLNFTRAMKKIIRRSRSIENEKEVLNEIGLLKQIDHPHIVKIFEFYVTKQAYFLITEMCSGGELFDRISTQGALDESHAAYIMYQVLSAVYNCHSRNILHRDLKPENILIDRIDDGGYLHVKIIDFGTAKVFEKDKAEQKVIGSAYYIAPEVLDKNYNEKCDLWSCGVILYILLTAKPPFGGSDDEIVRKIKVGVYDESEIMRKSNEVRDLIKRLLDMNPKTRLSAEEALRHPFFVKFETRKRLYYTSQEKFRHIINKLKNFSYQSKFQETALAFLVHNSLHLDEVRDLYKVFCLVDADLDGKITRNELGDAMRNIYKNENSKEIEKEVDIIFSNIDNDNNGTIEYEEFIRAVIGKESLLSDNILQFAFLFFDKDNSGEITLDEMQGIFGEDCDKNVLEKMIDEIDKDGNKEISFTEFKHMMLRLLQD